MFSNFRSRNLRQRREVFILQWAAYLYHLDRLSFRFKFTKHGHEVRFFRNQFRTYKFLQISSKSAEEYWVAFDSVQLFCYPASNTILLWCHYYQNAGLWGCALQIRCWFTGRSTAPISAYGPGWSLSKTSLRSLTVNACQDADVIRIRSTFQ